MISHLLDSLDDKQKELLLSGCLDRNNLIEVLEDMVNRLFWQLRRVRAVDYKRILNNAEVEFEKIFDIYRHKDEVIADSKSKR